MRTHNVPLCYKGIEKIFLLCSLNWHYDLHSLTRSTPFSKYFYVSKGVRVIEVKIGCE